MRTRRRRPIPRTCSPNWVRRGWRARPRPRGGGGGGGQPYEVYLQVLEEIAARWAAVAVAVSVHSLSSHPLLTFGTEEQKRRWLPGMLSGEQIGAYSLSEPQAGSDAAALRCAATKSDDGGYVIDGSKSWITHGGRADFYTLFARTGQGSDSGGQERSDRGSGGSISC